MIDSQEIEKTVHIILVYLHSVFPSDYIIIVQHQKKEVTKVQCVYSTVSFYHTYKCIHLCNYHHYQDTELFYHHRSLIKLEQW